jgi:hypothetical protein
MEDHPLQAKHHASNGFTIASAMTYLEGGFDAVGLSRDRLTKSTHGLLRRLP